ncbi:MAG: DUF2309 domain-containing protein [Gammaproteobacteria bacterium]|nr:DUF2309 domain-containing protein [Gammaproteobacteria bacterium]
MSDDHPIPGTIREALRQTVDHLEHLLPGQAPIRDFIHHNTLHGFQHLDFPEALAAARKVTGAYGYQSGEAFRAYYRQGRISHADLLAVLAADGRFDHQTPLIEAAGLQLTQAEVVLAAMVQPIEALTQCQLNWQMEEQQALGRFRDGVAYASRKRILDRSRRAEPQAVAELWQAALQRLGLQHQLLHPEELTDLGAEGAATLLDVQGAAASEAGPEAIHQVGGDEALCHTLMRRAATRLLDGLLGRVGEELTLRGLLLALTGHDIMEELRPALIRQLGAYLDQGLAAWHGDVRGEGFYRQWRDSAEEDHGWLFDDLPEWRDELELLPDEALDAVCDELQRLGLPEAQWGSYLERLALELPGWSGMFLWRHRHPGYQGLTPARVEMMDYLAVRLVLERIYAQRLCRRLWRIEASIEVLHWYFHRRRSELYVRHTLFNQQLPEYLVTAAQRLLGHYAVGDEYQEWQGLADKIWTWKQSPASDTRRGYTVADSGWRLFLLAQHLGLSGEELRALDEGQLAALFSALELDDESSGFLWLQAYERHYHEQIYNALTLNHGRGRWASRQTRPAAQVVFCIDDREEGIRRHLEELNPEIETLGAAGFFGVPINWRGLDDEQVTPLCPVVVTPAHQIDEVAQAGAEERLVQHNRGRTRRLRLQHLLHQEMRQRLLEAALLQLLSAPLALLTLLGRVLAPQRSGEWLARWRRHLEPAVPTRVIVTAEVDAEADAPTPERPRLGFSDREQADRVEGFLRGIGLHQGLGQLVVMMGHGSGSQNNPHLSAYDCGACSGRHGGPTARVFAAMANRPAVRALLAARGLLLPEDSWVVGAEHNTCDESIEWYDPDLVPEGLHEPFAALREVLDSAARLSAHERARRFASAPDTARLTPEQAWRHSVGRSRDFSQARPELGHATNAFAVVGRRAVTRGAFFDRRPFLISYDPTQDADGRVLESVLLAVGPVGAGINLEYYFSTVNNAGYGCGSKVTHNITGLLGVMHGANDDLRTGLPWQMVEIHEAMRLLVVVESTTGILTQIYQRQPPLQELIGKGWLLLAAKEPDSEAIHLFNPASGWRRWEGERQALAQVSCSTDWYSGRREPLAVSLIDQPEVCHGR